MAEFRNTRESGEHKGIAMGITLEQHRSAIGRFNPSGRLRESTKTMRRRMLHEFLLLLAIAKTRKEAEQVIFIGHNTTWV